MRPWLAVFRAESLSALRDRRAMLSALVFPLVGPVLVAVLFTSLAETFSSDGPLVVHVQGGDSAPALMAWLERKGVKIKAAKEAVTEGALLVVDPKYPLALAAGEPAPLHLVADFAIPQSAAEARRVQALVQGYAAELVTMRLMLRGVSPGILNAVELRQQDLATPQQHAANLLHVVPLFAILACFIGGMQVAIDVTAGERERGSLEALLISPATTTQIALGKWLVTTLFAASSALLTLMLSVISLSWAPLEALGVRGGLGASQALHLTLLIAPLVPVASAVQLYLSTFARSFREAQTFLSLLLFVPMIPGFIASVSPIDPQPWMMAVPALAQQVMLSGALRGDEADWIGLAATTMSSAALTALALWATGRALRREGILFAGQ